MMTAAQLAHMHTFGFLVLRRMVSLLVEQGFETSNV